ncbi:hypothetical protein [Holdemania sp. 1001302B_160321_E10]|nr:hypothetical protein [Holdemania sp. 1001302B_160321_E10]
MDQNRAILSQHRQLSPARFQTWQKIAHAAEELTYRLQAFLME